MLLIFTAMALGGDIAIFMILLGIERNPLVLGFATALGILGILGFGRLLFSIGGTAIDKLTVMWQNPFHTLPWILEYTAASFLLEQFDIPVPDYIQEWGIKKWSDIRKISKHVLDRGKKAYAQPILKKFFEERRDD